MDITKSSNKKEETMNFCSAKKRTLQCFVMKKADTANFCSQKKRTLQSLGGGTLYNCVLDTIKLYNRHYKTMDTTNLSASAIQTRSHARIRTLIQKSHASQKVTRLPSSSHNHHHNNGLPPRLPLATPTTTNIPGRPQTTTTAC